MGIRRRPSETRRTVETSTPNLSLRRPSHYPSQQRPGRPRSTDRRVKGNSTSASPPSSKSFPSPPPPSGVSTSDPRQDPGSSSGRSTSGPCPLVTSDQCRDKRNRPLGTHSYVTKSRPLLKRRGTVRHEKSRIRMVNDRYTWTLQRRGKTRIEF